jgi:hypothetical protein
MTTLITKNFKTILAKQVYNLLDVSSNSYLPLARKSYVYAFVGKQLPWNTGVEIPPLGSENVNSFNDYYKTGIFAKQVSLENSSLVVPRINWTSNTVYNSYLSNTNFYVLNSKDQVFKCLFNNSGAASLSEPELTLSTTSLEEPFLQTSDGYKWKYLYSLTSSQKQKFLTQEWMPVSVNKFVRAAAEPGSIDIVNVTNSGNNYVNGTTQNIITVSGDGSGAILTANVANGKVQNVVIQSRGNYYTYVDLVFSDVSGGIGTGASATASIAPHDGHGYDPIFELGASSIMFNVEFENGESGLLPTNNDFRQVVLLHNPFNYGTTTLAAASNYTLYTKVKVSTGVGDFNVDEVVYQGQTYDTRTFSAEVISFDIDNNILYLNNLRGTLELNKAIKGLTSGAIRVANVSTNPTLDLYSGKILYIANKLPVTRDASQTERIRFVLSF